MKYKITERDNKKKLYIYAEEKDELFTNGALGLANLLFEEVDKKKKLIRGFEKINIEAEDLSSLLTKFLNKVLEISKSENKVYPKLKILRFSKNRIEAHISGIDIDSFDFDPEGLKIEEIKKDSDKITAVFHLSFGELL